MAVSALAENREGRPTPVKVERPNVSGGDLDNTDSTSDRCSVCGSRIYAVESLRTGIGQDCRRRLVALLAGKDAPSSRRHEKGSQRREPSRSGQSAAAELIAGLRQAVEALEALLGGDR